MQVLAAAVVNQQPDVARAYVQALGWQEGDFSLDFAFLVDPECESKDALMEILPGRVEEADPKPEESNYSVDDTTHSWNSETFHWLGQQKQRLVETAAQHHYDAVWFVDSDLCCDPGTLQSLIDADAPLVSGVFWTRWQPSQPALPQVWLNHPYELSGRGWQQHEFLEALSKRRRTEVYGLGACTLIRSDAFEKVAYFPPVPGLPDGGMWQGEDRHFCIRAEQNHVTMIADPWPDIWHCYRPADRPDLDARLDDLQARRKRSASFGDLVSFTIEPLEEPELADYKQQIRGRLGALDVLPEIESALEEMTVRDERLMKLHFPLWYDIPPYRGQDRLVRLKLLDAKSPLPHPGLERDESWQTTPAYDSYLTPAQILQLRQSEVME